MLDPQEKLRKLKSAQILRSLAQKTSFGSAAVEVVSCRMIQLGLLDILAIYVAYDLRHDIAAGQEHQCAQGLCAGTPEGLCPSR